jgi:carboxyl-terminal processing protease
MKYIYTFFFLFFIISCSDVKKTTVTPKDYLDEVFKIVEEHSIRRDSVDFNEIKREAYARLKNAGSIENCYPIVKIILIDLGDRHSFFMPKEQVEKWQSTSKAVDTNEIITFKTKLLNKNIGYIHMKGFSSGDSVSIRQYADSLQSEIKSIDNKKLKGWILDLRENTGGNCWPMLTGLGPLLGNGICGYFIDNNKMKSSWFYRDGESGIDSVAIVSVSKQPYKLFNDLNPIAVLTGSRTVSSGEVVVTAFHSKNNARSFGESTGGLSTANANFVLSDGSMILLTSSIYADSEGNIFGKRIEPAEKISFSYQSIGQPNDPVIKKAMDWIYEN